MHFFIHLTTKCDLHCSYCEGASDEMLFCSSREWNLTYPPSEVSYSIDALKKFIEKDKDPWLIFYGGEPLLRTKLIEDIMNEVPAKYILQTNGTHLKSIGNILNKFDTILVSIDGKEETTDAFRGKGVYKTVIDAVKWARKKGFNNEIIGRMTVMEPTNIKEEVLHLINLNLFDSIHWQLNAMFWEDLGLRKFSEWVEQYNKNLKELIEIWVEKLQEGIVWKIYPFIGIIQSLLKKEKSRLRCGSGWAQYSILTDGNIAPCVAMAGMKEYYCGNIFDSDPDNLKVIEIGEPCTSCDLFELCGGRCLFADKTKLWGKEGYVELKKTVKTLIETLQNQMPEIKKLIETGVISEKDFEFHKFNSCEIIP